MSEVVIAGREGLTSRELLSAAQSVLAEVVERIAIYGEDDLPDEARDEGLALACRFERVLFRAQDAVRDAKYGILRGVES